MKNALDKKGFRSLTVSQVSGRGIQKGLALQWRVGEYRVDLLPKLKLKVVVNDEDYPAVMDIICEVARTGDVGDGMIFVLPVEQICRVRTGERGEVALTPKDNNKKQ